MIVQETLFSVKRVKLYGLITFLLLKRSFSVFVNSIFEVFFPRIIITLRQHSNVRTAQWSCWEIIFLRILNTELTVIIAPLHPNHEWQKSFLIRYSTATVKLRHPMWNNVFTSIARKVQFFLWSLVSICHFIQLVNVHAATLLTLTLDVVSEPEIFTPQTRNRKPKDECI